VKYVIGLYRPLPPLGTLRTLDTAARLLSLTMVTTDLARTQTTIGGELLGTFTAAEFAKPRSSTRTSPNTVSLPN
jgi:hypothetical protein